ncbi:MAG TPA: isopentenyl-diphosphate Delta-isomerase [Candidatus Thermoplasmatota archaeon]|jgi:isopentenyl-diphosphate delta-isomerase|nr:isopentenyl-diphosphate Delta-isomerase [Candidatus Thermoplasmatota archaeon]
MSERIILVDEHDNALGPEDKLKAHEGHGTLHRAFSIFIFNTKGETLLQQRAKAKYHFGGLWTNACCSHPRWGEQLEQAVHRRLKDECGFDTELRELFSFIYQADWDGKIGEHEYDHVFVGQHDGPVPGNAEEADAWAWVEPAQLRRDVAAHPERYSPWFKIALERVLAARGER